MCKIEECVFGGGLDGGGPKQQREICTAASVARQLPSKHKFHSVERVIHLHSLFPSPSCPRKRAREHSGSSLSVVLAIFDSMEGVGARHSLPASLYATKKESLGDKRKVKRHDRLKQSKIPSPTRAVILS